MLDESILKSRTRELFESSSVMQYKEYDEKIEIVCNVLDSLRKLIPSKHIKQFEKLIDDYEVAQDNIINLFELEAYKQGFIDAFEVYSLVYPVKK